MTRPAPILVIAPFGSYRTVPFINAARALKADVVIASEGQYALAAHDARAIHIDFRNQETAIAKLLALARTEKFTAVIGTDDGSTVIAARVAAALGLPHNPPAAVAIARRKDLARACLANAGVRVPVHRRIDLTQSLAPQLERLQFPVVIKPIGLSASRGVMRADNMDALLRTAARLHTMLNEIVDAEERRYALIEQFIPGFEIAVEGLLRDGVLELLTIFDKPDPLDGPFFEETYYITPSRLSASQQAAVRQELNHACVAYGLREGPVHAECRINAEGVWIIEVAARTIGGLCGRLLRFGTGRSLEEIVLLHALRRPLALQTANGAAGVLMIPIRQAGILRRVEGIDAAERVAGIEEINIQVREGYELVPLPEGGSYFGFIFARGADAETVEQALRQAHARLNIVVSPLWRAQASISA